MKQVGSPKSRRTRALLVFYYPLSPTHATPTTNLRGVSKEFAPRTRGGGDRVEHWILRKLPDCMGGFQEHSDQHPYCIASASNHRTTLSTPSSTLTKHHQQLSPYLEHIKTQPHPKQHLTRTGCAAEAMPATTAPP